MRLPTKLDLGLAIIRVKLVTRAEMADEMDDDPGDTVAEAAWDDEEKTIYIRRDLSMKRKREVLFHELTHAMIDLREHVGGTHERD